MGCMQATTSLFFLAITYTDGLAVVALALLEYILVLMLFMFLHLANFKGRQVRPKAAYSCSVKVAALQGCCCCLPDGLFSYLCGR